MNYPEPIKEAAKQMYLQKYSAKEIAKQLNINSSRVVYQWRDKGAWDSMLGHETIEQATARRLNVLVQKEKKSDGDYKEIIQLSNLLDKMAGIDLKKAKALKEKLAAERGEESGSKKRNLKKIKNDISYFTADILKEIREKLFFEYQLNWYEHKSERTRFILKSRQIGATFYMAWEAFEDAILTGDNQVFLSASRSQSEVFKAYIIKFAKDYGDIELKGSNTIVLNNGAELRFVSTSVRTAQGYNGHLYVDEVFWIPDFDKLNKVASAMASQKKWRKTYFSTPSLKSHGAYPMWSGEKFNKDRTEKDKREFDLSHKTLKDGFKGADGIWRNIVTIVDAEEQGCDLFNIDELRLEYNAVEFNTLFMCGFMEAGQSVFALGDLLSCAVDSNVIWVDFKKKEKRPYGNKGVWIGYDPARRGDRSSVVVLAPPNNEKGKFRVLEKIQLTGNFRYQASQIKSLTEKYNVEFIGVDCTGPGLGVFEQIQQFFPRVTAIHYSLESKNRLVLKAMDLIENGRIEWDAEHKEIPHAFLQIHQTTTNGDKVTYSANRNNETGHADVAWSIMHAVSNEPLTEKRKASIAMSN
ncbi:MAG: terminase family protein [Cellvibrionaceae bacterium]